MRIIIITQNDPFYLAKNLDHLFASMPGYVQVVGCVVSNVSPFGKKESFLNHALKTWRIFGTGFFIRYGIRFLLAKVNSSASVLHTLRRHGISRIELTGSINSEESIELLRAKSPDLLISIAGNEIFRRPLIELASKGCLNLHTSLLPRYRGLMPSFWVLKNREKETGVSVFYVDEGIDSGPIIVQKRILLDGMTHERLIRESKHLGMEAIIESIDLIHRGDVNLIPNDDAEKTYFSFPTREDVNAFKSAGARFY